MNDLQFSTARLSPSTLITHTSKPVLAPSFTWDLASILHSFPYLPSESCLLGMGEDNAPIILNLLDPTPGPLLILGSRGAGKTHLLRTLVRSAQAINPSGSVRAVVLSDDLSEWQREAATPTLQALASLYADAAVHHLEELGRLVEARHCGKQLGESLLLIVDGLNHISDMDAEIRVLFQYLLREGPTTRVWPMVSLEPQHTRSMAHWIRHFSTPILGSLPRNLNKATQANVDLQTGQFVVRTRSGWKVFWTPSINPQGY
jgi:hypothetical protein